MVFDATLAIPAPLLPTVPFELESANCDPQSPDNTGKDSEMNFLAICIEALNHVWGIEGLNHVWGIFPAILG